MAPLHVISYRQSRKPSASWSSSECLRQTDDDQDADGFRDCLYEITWSGAIGDNYGFDENGDVTGVTHVVIEVLPLAERTEENLGYKILGPPPTP